MPKSAGIRLVVFVENRYLGKYVTFGYNGEDEGVLTVRELAGPVRVLPDIVLLKQHGL